MWWSGPHGGVPARTLTRSEHAQGDRSFIGSESAHPWGRGFLAAGMVATDQPDGNVARPAAAIFQGSLRIGSDDPGGRLSGTMLFSVSAMAMHDDLVHLRLPTLDRSTLQCHN